MTSTYFLDPKELKNIKICMNIKHMNFEPSGNEFTIKILRNLTRSMRCLKLGSSISVRRIT